MTPLLYRIGQFCARRRLLVLGVWLVLAAGLGVWAHQLGGTEVTNNVTLPGTGSQSAADVLQDGFGTAGVNGSNPIVLRAPTGATLTGARQRAAVQRQRGRAARSVSAM